MLVVTTTVRMVDGVHSNTTSLGPRVALGSELYLISTIPFCPLFFQRTLCLALEALRRGLSVRPPPATIPTIPRQELERTFLAPEGSLSTLR